MQHSFRDFQSSLLWLFSTAEFKSSEKLCHGLPEGDGNFAALPGYPWQVPVQSTGISRGPLDSTAQLLLTGLPWDWAPPMGNRKSKFLLWVVVLHLVLTDAITDIHYYVINWCWIAVIQTNSWKRLSYKTALHYLILLLLLLLHCYYNITITKLLWHLNLLELLLITIKPKPQGTACRPLEDEVVFISLH